METNETTETPSTSIIPEEEKPRVEVPEGVTVIASNPVEMAHAQADMIAKVEQRIEQTKKEIALAEENLEQAKSQKIKTSGWRTVLRKFQGELTYYEKVLLALQNGYFVVPDMPVSLIAVRTDKMRATHGKTETCGMNIKDETPLNLPVGEGHYVAPEVPVERWMEEEKIEGKDYPKRTAMVKATGELLPPDFPIKIVRPEILSELGRAQKMRIFDAIGLAPADMRSRKRDPMIIGIISTAKERMDSWVNGSHATSAVPRGHRRMCFLLKWWLDLDSI